MNKSEIILFILVTVLGVMVAYLLDTNKRIISALDSSFKAQLEQSNVINKHQKAIRQIQSIFVQLGILSYPKKQDPKRPSLTLIKGDKE